MLPWVCFLLSTPGAWADESLDDEYLESYASGLEAYALDQWAEAAESFLRAIAEKPEAGGTVVAGGESHPYIPHHRLALSLYFDGRLGQAEAAWAESERQGIVAGNFPEEQSLAEKYRADIAVRIEERQHVREAVVRQIERAERQIVLLGEARLQSVLDADATLAQRRQDSLEELQRARAILRQEHADKNLLAEAHARAVQSTAWLGAIVLEATKRAVGASEGQ